MRLLPKRKYIPWYVYLVANHATEEIYIGVKKDVGSAANHAGAAKSIKARWKKHCAGETKTLRGWDCDVDDVQYLGSMKVRTQTRASELAHEMERDAEVIGRWFERAYRLVVDDDYLVFLTAGV